MSLGDTFSMSGPSNPSASPISEDMAAALAKAFPDAAPAEPEVSPEAPAIEGTDDGGDGPAAVPPVAPSDLAEPLDLDPAGGPGDLPSDLTPAETDGFVIADTPTGAVTDPATPATPPAAAADELDLNDLFTRWTGRKPSAQEMTNLFGFIDQFSSLTPQQQAQVNAIVSGQQPAYDPGPAAQQNLGIDSNRPAAPPSSIELPDLSTLDDGARALLEPIYTNMQRQEALLQEQLVAAQQQQFAQQQIQHQQAAAQGSQAFIDQYSQYLTANDMVLLETKASRAGNIALHLQQANGDMAAAYKSMLEATLFADPEMRTRVAQATTNAAAQQAAADAQRVQKAAAVAAGGAPATPPPTPRKPRGNQVDPTQTKFERDAARQAAIREAATAAAAAISAETGLSVR